MNVRSASEFYKVILDTIGASPVDMLWKARSSRNAQIDNWFRGLVPATTAAEHILYLYNNYPQVFIDLAQETIFSRQSFESDYRQIYALLMGGRWRIVAGGDLVSEPNNITNVILEVMRYAGVGGGIGDGIGATQIRQILLEFAVRNPEGRVELLNHVVAFSNWRTQFRLTAR